MKITSQIVEKHGLSLDEYEKIKKILNKRPFVIRDNLSLENKIQKLKKSARLRAPIINENDQVV